MNFFDSYWDAAEAISSKSGRREFIVACVEYYYSGGEPPEIRNAQARVAFAAVKFSLDRAVRGRRNRETSLRAAKDPSSPPPSGFGSSGSARRRSQRMRGSDMEPSFKIVAGRRRPDALSPHVLACLAAANKELGTDCWTIPPQESKTLDDSSGAYGPADVQAMARMVAERGIAFDGRRPVPRDLFDPARFHSLMEAALLGGYLDDRCGRGDALEL